MCSHSYCRYTAFKETPTSKLFHSNINDKNALQAKHNRKVGLPGSGIVALHRNQCSSCKNTYGGMVQLSTQTYGGMIIVLVREWFTLKCFVGDGVV